VLLQATKVMKRVKWLMRPAYRRLKRILRHNPLHRVSGQIPAARLPFRIDTVRYDLTRRYVSKSVHAMQSALLAYICLADDFRETIRRGSHPLGKTLKQRLMEKVARGPALPVIPKVTLVLVDTSLDICMKKTIQVMVTRNTRGRWAC
jgi:hypothetical protein